MSPEPHIRILFHRYLDNQCNTDELELIINYFHTSEETDLRELIVEALFDENVTENKTAQHRDKLQTIFIRLNKSIDDTAKKEVSKYRIPIWSRVAAAAVLFAFSGSLYFLLHKRNSTQQSAQIVLHDLAPGSNKAILTLANGKQIDLTDAQNGKLAVQGNTAIDKTADGKVVYNAAPAIAENSTTTVAYNTMTTPLGGQYHLILADGTNVWLNAGSSLKYPTTFSGHERLVELKGEAYFEVVHNTALPFKVKTEGQVVEDIGTHFNINAYDNEPTLKTTLLEGAINIKTANTECGMVPGQQATLTNEGLTIKETNVYEAASWKNGYFSFKQSDIRDVMRQFSRWYNVRVAYEGPVPDVKLTGRVYRKVDGEQALKILSYFNIHFKVENNTITITQ